jgi:hypothetical protein
LRPQGEQSPPQSTLVSLPLRVRSAHDDVRQIMSAQLPSTQSVPTRQRWPIAHGGHADPPQSWSVSLESWTPLSHDAVAQVPFTQAAVRQSAPLAHAFPLSQRGQSPPQSTSLSLPFFAPSAQPAGGG